MEDRVPEEHIVHRSLAVRAGVVSLVAGSAIMAAKFAAYLITGSTAILADAAESIVNVIAAAIVTFGVVVASRPADADHPYGHGKVEFLSAAMEGGMILVAATLIVVEAIRQIVTGPELQQVGTGILIAATAGLANLGLGLYLLQVGRRERSAALVADGMHVLSDVITTVGTVVALVAVRITGFMLLDPLVAIAIGAYILRTGWKVVRPAVAGLLDEADFDLLDSIARHLEETHRPEWVEMHQLRVWSSGALTHADLHLTVPRYLSVEQAHNAADELERRLIDGIEGQADLVVHIDPCLPRHCSACRMPDCPVRSEPARQPFAFTVENLTRAGSV